MCTVVLRKEVFKEFVLTLCHPSLPPTPPPPAEGSPALSLAPQTIAARSAGCKPRPQDQPHQKPTHIGPTPTPSTSSLHKPQLHISTTFPCIRQRSPHPLADHPALALLAPLLCSRARSLTTARSTTTAARSTTARSFQTPRMTWTEINVKGSGREREGSGRERAGNVRGALYEVTGPAHCGDRALHSGGDDTPGGAVRDRGGAAAMIAVAGRVYRDGNCIEGSSHGPRQGTQGHGEAIGGPGSIVCILVPALPFDKVR